MMEDFNRLYKENQVFVLPKHTKITEEVIRRFDHLMDVATPREFRNNITEIYLQYIITHHDMLPIDFDKMATNLYFLIDFLSDIEKEMGKKKAS